MDDVLSFINGSTPQEVVEPTPPAEEIITTTNEPTPAPVEPTPDVVEKFSLSELGDYKSLDELKSVVSKAKSFSEKDINELTVLRQEAAKLKSLQEENEKLKNVNPYKNSDYFRLQHLEETDPEMAPVYKKLVFGGLDAKEKVKIGFIVDHPELKDDKAKVERYVQRKYAALYNPDLTAEDQEYQDALFDLELDANKVEKELRSKFNSIAVPDPVKENQDKKAEYDSFVNQWDSLIKDSFKTLGKLPVTVFSEGGKDKETLFEFDIPSDEKFAQQALNYCVSNKLPATPENLESVKTLMKKLHVLENLDEYNTSLAEHVAKSKDGLWRKKVNNPSTVTEPKPVSDIKADPSRSLLDEILKY